ncbi:signal transduction histidine kinase [Halospina denitrificans]|uniref:histidine kinase n=1 Tax=Halospina denitrificans TaxID=332522 RepID=A0A4R7JZ68_9GAMM|nr:hybrid sensor histidine kinase/response regulator [Halospina denitrificans]TDT43406.1 signal transduction histidine kinase [Halospina denitrificans]
MTYEQLQKQKQQGFKGLRFSEPLETAYQQHRAQNMRLRARPVAASALVLFIVYALLDFQTLPLELAEQTVVVRLFLICPLIIAILALSYSQLNPIHFARCYTLSFLIGGLFIVLILYLARRQGDPLPYDGLHIMLMFGYLVMGLPFRGAALMASGIVAAYIAMETSMKVPGISATANGYFLLTTHAIGMVGAWLQEHAGRHHYLDSSMLERARQQAQSASHQKTRFIAAASHDLRQPLNVINLLVDNLQKESDETRREAIIERLGHSTTQLNRLLHTLLDISRIKEGMVQPDIRPLLITNILEQVRLSVEERAQADGVAFTIEDMPKASGVAADPTLLHRVLVNLVYNALKHAGADNVRLSAVQSGARIRFQVSDNGSGIPEAIQSRLFEAFYRPEEGPVEDKGLGLGLAIVKELTELMGGRCGVQSAPGSGSDFWVELPSRPPPPDALPESAIKGRTALVEDGVLVVEDQSDTRQWLQSMIRNWGYTAVACPDCQSARDAVDETGPFALVMTDLNLPDGSGMELIQEFRSHYPQLPALVITGDAETVDDVPTDQSLRILHKPLAPARLHTAIRQIMGVA